MTPIRFVPPKKLLRLLATCLPMAWCGAQAVDVTNIEANVLGASKDGKTFDRSVNKSINQLQTDGRRNSKIGCRTIEGLFKFQSTDGYRKNEIMIFISPTTHQREVTALGTWKPASNDDGGNLHSGRIEAQSELSKCDVSFPTTELNCKVDLRFLGKKAIDIQQIGSCLTFGAGVDLSGTYTKIK